MCPTTGENASTAESLFQAVDAALKKDQLNWSKCVSFGVDNCNTNIGCNNSMQTRILNENKNCFIAGYSCHLAHLAAGAGGRAFQKVSNFDVEDHQVDLYYYVKGSTRQKGILIEYFRVRRPLNGKKCLDLLRQGGFVSRDAAIKSRENTQH